MTLPEMKDYFSLIYNNIDSNMAPGLLDSEIEMYLNRAQDTVTDQLYNKYEQSEEARKSLIELVKSISLSPEQVVGFKRITSDSTAFKLPNDVLYIVYESCTLQSSDKCLNNNTILIIPVTHDDYNKVSRDPFKGYSKSKALRLDISDDNNRYSEIVYNFNAKINSYNIRYIKRPRRISFENNVSCELSEALHETIVETAAALATASFKKS